MFRKEADFGAFERVMVETHQRQPLRILSWRPSAFPIALCRAKSFVGGVGRPSTTVAVGQPVVENARKSGDQGIVIALAD